MHFISSEDIAEILLFHIDIVRETYFYLYEE